jgi:predicted PurR-regulated permease PerM
MKGAPAKRTHPLPRREKRGQFPFFAVLSWGLLVFLVIKSLALVFQIIGPFLAPLVIACLLATAFHPVHQRVYKLLGARENASAFVSVVLVVVVVVVPVGFLIAGIVDQGLTVLENARDWQQQGHWRKVFESDRVMEFVNHPQVDSLLDRLEIAEGPEGRRSPEDLVPLIAKGGTRALDGFIGDIPAVVGSVFGNVFINLLNVLIALFAMFYAFRDGPKMLRYARDMLPLKATHEMAILTQLRNITRAIVVGMFLTSASQALVAMVGFKIVGVPTLFWGVVVGFASLIPVVGTASVWFPISVYLYFQGQTGKALFLVLWGAFIVASVDNFLRPYFMKGQSGMSTIVLFFALIGGIKLYGPMGLIYGPVIFSICAVVLYIFRIENREALRNLANR